MSGDGILRGESNLILINIKDYVKFHHKYMIYAQNRFSSVTEKIAAGMLWCIELFTHANKGFKWISNIWVYSQKKSPINLLDMIGNSTLSRAECKLYLLVYVSENSEECFRSNRVSAKSGKSGKSQGIHFTP